jgi:hypothetical protein
MEIENLFNYVLKPWPPAAPFLPEQLAPPAPPLNNIYVYNIHQDLFFKSKTCSSISAFKYNILVSKTFYLF